MPSGTAYPLKTPNWQNSSLALSSPFLFQLSRGIVSPVLPLYFASLGYPAVEIGILFSVWGVGTIIFEPTIGALADKGGRNAMMYALCLCTFALYLLFAFAGSFIALLALQFFLGGVYAGAAVLFRYSIPSIVSPDKPSAAYGLLGSAYSGAAVLGSLTGGLVLSSSGYILPFYLASAAAVLSIIPLKLSGMTGRVARAPSETGEEPVRGWTRSPELILMGGMAMSAFLVFSVTITMIPLVVTASPFYSDPVGVGVLLATFNGSLFVFLPVMGRVGASRPRTWMSIGLILGALCFLVLVVAKIMPVAYASVIMAGVSFSAISTLSLARFIKLVPSSRRGVAIGVYGAAEDIGVIVGPLAFSAVWASLGLDFALVATSAILLTVLVAYILPRSSLRPADTARTIGA